MAIDYNDERLRNADTRKGEFREIAREIVWKDRNSKKFGGSIDTAGAIASAMAKAYKLGMAHASIEPAPEATETSPNEALPWNSIPRRARDAFESIQRLKAPVAHRIIPGAPSGSPRHWTVYWDNGEGKAANERYTAYRNYGPSTIAPLINLGLMEEVNTEHYVMLDLTLKGEATWERAIDDGLVRIV